MRSGRARNRKMWPGKRAFCLIPPAASLFFICASVSTGTRDRTLKPTETGEDFVLESTKRRSRLSIVYCWSVRLWPRLIMVVAILSYHRSKNFCIYGRHFKSEISSIQADWFYIIILLFLFLRLRIESKKGFKRNVYEAPPLNASLYQSLANINTNSWFKGRARVACWGFSISRPNYLFGGPVLVYFPVPPSASRFSDRRLNLEKSREHLTLLSFRQTKRFPWLTRKICAKMKREDNKEQMRTSLSRLGFLFASSLSVQARW